LQLNITLNSIYLRYFQLLTALICIIHKAEELVMKELCLSAGGLLIAVIHLTGKVR